MAAPDTGQLITSYGPIIVAAAALVSGLVAALGRKDKKAEAQTTALDDKTNTILNGLTLALNNADKERAYWESRAKEAERLYDDVCEKHEQCEDEKEELRMKIPASKRPRKK